MALQTPIRFGDIALQIEDSVGAGTYSTLCGITSVQYSTSVNTQAEEDLDCDDPDAVTFEGAIKISVGVEVTFGGQVDPEASDTLFELAFEDETDDRKVRLVYNKGSKVGYYQFPAILTSAQEGYERRQKGTMSGTLKATDRPVWTAT
jgi:hypothetical protein